MKLLKKLSFAFMAAACVGSASAAPTVIHVVGSTAFRAATTIAIVDALRGSTPTSTGTKSVFCAFTGTNLSSAGQQIFANGTTSGGSPTATIVVETFWTGSLAGVVDLVAQTSAASFLNETDTTVQGAIDATQINFATGYQASGSGVNFTATGHVHTSSTIEMAMSDSYQGTISKELGTGMSFQNTGVGSFTPASLATACAGNTIVDAGTSSFAGKAGVVAIVPFEWVLGNINTGVAHTYSDSSTLVLPTNITTQQSRQLLTSGYVPQGLFTGTSTVADSSNWFLFVGRNEDSGTRIGYLMESQFGVTANPIQWAVDGSSYNNGTTAGIAVVGTQQFPKNVALNTEPNILWKNHFGHSGYAGGSDVAGILKASQSGTTTWASGAEPSDIPATSDVYFTSSIGLTDAASVISAGGTALKYNGVAYSPAAVQNGSYSHWEFEHCYRQASQTGTTIGNFIDQTADMIFAVDADAVYNATTATSTVDHTTTSIGVFHTEKSDGTYDIEFGLAPGVKFDDFCTATRALSEGGPISPTF